MIDVKPCSPHAEKLANAIIVLMDAEKDLREAKRNVPHYTGHLSASDYYAIEQEAWNRAADSLAELLEGKK